MFAHEVGSGTPVVLLHGFGLDHRSLLPLEPVFEGAWRRIYLDLPWAAGSAQAIAEAVAGELGQRLGGEPFAVLGGSFGGMIARYVAHELRGQVLGLATMAGVFVAQHDKREVPPRTVLRRDVRVEGILGGAVKDYREDAVVESERDARDFLEFVLPGIEGADQRALERIAASYTLDREPEEAHPEPFLQPSLHITGRQDDVVGYQDAWRRQGHYPRATYATLDAAGHNLLFEQRDLVAALVAEWLSRIS
jgi:pimeloyl-ACP methyl ester carboxylesterase